MAKGESAKGKKLGTVEAPPERPGGEPAPLPPVGRSIAIVAGIGAATFGAFLFFLGRHEPRPGWIALGVGVAAIMWLERKLPGLRERFLLRRGRKDGKRLIKSVQQALKKQGQWLGSEAKAKLENATTTLEKAMAAEDLAALEFAMKKLEDAAEAHLTRKAPTREYVEQIGGAILAALFIRAFFYEAFKIPSGSMLPTLLVGDHLFVNKFIYGLRIPFTVDKVLAQVPERGDIVVFNKPGDEKGDDLIKRVIGLPGDVVEVRNRHITVNGKPLETRNVATYRLNAEGDSDKETEEGPFGTYLAFEEHVGEHVHLSLEEENTYFQSWQEGRWVVEPGHVFVMGDNRDNSADSRVPRNGGGFGQVPLGHIKGRADVIWLSLGGPHGVRFSRMFSLLH